MHLPLSVFIIAQDEADRIGRTIESVKGWVDEIIVIDSGSSDNTVALSEALGARTVYHAWNGYGPQKVYGEKTCTHDWVLNLDADEEITPELRDELIALFQNGEPAQAGYFIKRKMLFRFQDAPPPFAPSDWFLRLYDRRRAGFKDSPVHDSVEMRDGSTPARLNHIMLHRCFRSYTHWAEKINRYSSMQADNALAHGKRVSALKILTDPFLSFLKSYFLRRYFIYGLDGFIHSVFYVYARMAKFAKIRELYQQRAWEERQGRF